MTGFSSDGQELKRREASPSARPLKATSPYGEPQRGFPSFWVSLKSTVRNVPPTLWIGLFVAIELILLRYMALGRYAALSETDNGVLLLWAHTATKALVLLYFVGFLAVILSRGSIAPSIRSISARRILLAANIASCLGLSFVLVRLPLGELEASQLNTSQIWTYTTGIVCLFAVVASGAGLIWSSAYRSGRALAYGTAGILTAGTYTGHLDPFILGGRNLIEGTALELSLWFYGLSGRPLPTVDYGGQDPIMSVPQFSISIAASCSGYQGMLSAFVLLGTYIVVERPSLRLERAVLLCMLGVGGTFILNALRIAVLFYIGEEISTDVAVNGFHSQFGTLSLLVVSAAAMLIMEHSTFRRVPSSGALVELGMPEGELQRIAVLMLPLAAYLLIAMITGLFVGTFNWFYPLPVALCIPLLWYFRETLYREFLTPPSLLAIAVGFATYLLWIVLVPTDTERDTMLSSTLKSAPIWIAVIWIFFRVLGSSLLVPAIEELAFRGALLRLFERMVPTSFGAASALTVSLLGSSLAFGLLHSNIFAGFVAGFMFGALYLWRRALSDAIVAHGTTNFLICLHVLGLGEWSYW